MLCLRSAERFLSTAFLRGEIEKKQQACYNLGRELMKG